MLFNSYEFIFAFLPFAFAVYFVLQHYGMEFEARVSLVLTSLFFYSWWNIAYLPLILISIFVNYFLGKRLCGDKTQLVSRTKKVLLFVGVVFNLGLLCYFKYADFFIENFNSLSGSGISSLNLALPLAISFFTFQQIAYLVDSYRGEAKQADFVTYAAFVSFFPQLIAGPIVHNKEMIPQFLSKSNRKIDYGNIAVGLFIFSIGLFKKVAIADTFAVWATTGFDVATTLQFVEAWITALSYSFQLYFDFSGYTDMAIGIALLFNIRLPANFNSPYKALDLQDFWRRWHITLSRFLRDYLYIPLGGNRNGEIATYTNLMITFLLGGLWHGAGWTFVFWGFLHGFGLCVNRAWKRIGIRLWASVAWLITFLYVVVAWVFFRAEEWADAIKVLSGVAGLNGIRVPEILSRKIPLLEELGVEFGNSVININGNWQTLVWVMFGMAAILLAKNTIQLKEGFVSHYKSMVVTICCFCVSVLMIGKASEFLYFNF